MHETAVAQRLITILLEQAKQHSIRRISVVRLKVGRLRGLDLRQIRGVFELFAEGTIAEGARVDIDDVAVEASCRTCSMVWQVDGYRFECPACGGSDAEVTKGRELHIVSFDGDHDAPDPVTHPNPPVVI